MIKRIQGIIEREKVKNPGQPGLLLLVRRICFVLHNQFRIISIEVRRDSTFSSKAEMYMCSLLPVKVLDIVISDLQPKSILDVGCGTGKTLEYYLNHNIDALGVENSKTAISLSAVQNKIIRYNLNRELNLHKSFDLVWCFEVIEHIHPKFEYNFLKTLTNHGSVIILSAARPGQGGQGHFNEQEPAYWISKFSALGYKLDNRLTQKLRTTGEMHAENLLCFIK